MNPDMTPKGMLLDVSVLTEFLFNKHTILMRLRNIFKKIKFCLLSLHTTKNDLTIMLGLLR